MYLSRKDFERHGYSDGCVGCRVIASGKKGRTGVADYRARRRQMEGIVKECDPARWARHVRKNGEAEAEGDAGTGIGPAVPRAPDGGRAIGR